MFKKGFKFFEGHREPVMEVGGGEDTGIEVTFAHDSDVFCPSIVFRKRDRFEVFRSVVSRTAVEMVDAVRVIGDRSDKSRINGMRDKDVFTFVKSMFELQIPLFTTGICFVLRVLASSGCRIHNGLDTVDDTASLRAVPFDPKDHIITEGIGYNFVHT